MERHAMARDPVEVMGNVVAQEVSRLQSLHDSDMVLDALAISEAERRRSRLADRLEAAVGLTIGVHLLGERLSGFVRAAGAEVMVIESLGQITAVAVGSLMSIEGLPKALRAEHQQLPPAPVTWSTVMREWSESALIRFTLSDGRCVAAWVDSVGSDHLDLRDSEGESLVVLLSAIRKATISR
jgi:hypothetical protein